MNKTRKFAIVAAVLTVVGWTGTARAQEAAGNLRYSITVSKFENQSGWRGQWDLGDAWGAVMTDALQASGRFIVLGEGDMRAEAMREQDLGASGRTAGGAKTPAIGQMTPAQLLVKGAITHAQGSTTGGEGGIGFKGIRLGGGTDAGEVNATVYIVDSRTGQVKSSTKVVGRAGRKKLSVGYSGGALGGLTGGLSGFKKDNVGKATEDAVEQAVAFLVQQLETIPWQGSVILASPERVIVNRGVREGVAVGQQFVVGTAEELVDPDTGEVLDVSMTQVATLQVVDAKEKIATCKVLDGDAAGIQKGMTVQPAR
jgi:curli biogenesis system outer membrane secretion channel CsgG